MSDSLQPHGNLVLAVYNKPKLVFYQALLLAQMVKNLPVMQETWVQTLCWEIPLEKETATHSSILAWRISWTKEPGGLQSMGSELEATE